MPSVFAFATPLPVSLSISSASTFTPSNRVHLRHHRPLRPSVPPPFSRPSPRPCRTTRATLTAALPALPAALHTAASLSAYAAMQRSAGALLAAQSISFPAPLAAMLALLALTLLARAVASSDAPIDSTIATIFGPASALLARWLAVFFVPNLVMLPLAPRLPGADVAKIALVVLGGFAASLGSTVVVARGIRAAVTAPGTGAESEGGAAAGGAKASPPPAPPSDGLMRAFAAVAVLALGAAVAVARGVVEVGAGAAAMPVRIYGLVLTLLTFSFGQRLPKGVKTVLHPLITCTVGTIVGMGLLGSLTGVGFNAALSAYYVRSGAGWGGGNVLAALLGPAVVSFAFQIDGRRRLLADRFVEIVGTSFIGAAFGLFGSAAAARALRASEAVRLMLVPRQVTAPLAIPIAAMLGADVAMAATIVALTGLVGANVGRAVLTALKVNDPVTRGLAAGTSAHGLGTAAMNEEPAAFPFAALAMALVGIFSTVLVATPAVRALLLRVALGKLTGAKVA